MQNDEYMSLLELAKILGISRIAVYKKVKKGQIKAIKVGRAYAVSKKEVASFMGKILSKDSKKEIDQAVKRVVNEYGETLKLLGKE